MNALRLLGMMALIGGTGFALAIGCKKKQPVQYPPATATAVAPTATTTPPTPTAVPDAGPPAPAALDEATKLQLAEMIEARSKKEALGMKPVGEVFGGVAATGAKVESPIFMIEAAKCYVVIGQGGMGVTELDLAILGAAGIALPGMEPQLAIDNTSGAAATITPCYKPMLGGPAKIALTARGGSGPVVARVYAK